MRQHTGNRGPPREDMKIVLARIGAFVCLALLLIISVLKVETSANEQYEQYMESFSKHYEQNEKQYRMYLKIKKDMANHKHNADPDNDYYRGINEFSDLTQEQFERLHMSINQLRIDKGVDFESLSREADSKLNISWIENLPPVKDRGRCHADYAFATVGAVEGLINIKNNATMTSAVALSEQQIIDCCENCSGCSGMDLPNGSTTKDVIAAFEYIHEFGLEKEVAYPYQNTKEECRRNPNIEGQKIADFRLVNTFTGLLRALKEGPVVVTVDARNWRDYTTGVFTNCGRKKTHVALLVGRTPEYFVVRNSWGRRWGERGYIRIGIGYTCGIPNEAYAPEL